MKLKCNVAPVGVACLQVQNAAVGFKIELHGAASNCQNSSIRKVAETAMRLNDDSVAGQLRTNRGPRTSFQSMLSFEETEGFNCHQPPGTVSLHCNRREPGSYRRSR
jgi:hypothetical protein